MDNKQSPEGEKYNRDMARFRDPQAWSAGATPDERHERITLMTTKLYSPEAERLAADEKYLRSHEVPSAGATPDQGAAPLVGTGEMVSQRVGLEIAVVSLASIFPEDALKAFTCEEIMEMGKKNEHLAGHEIFALLKTALTNPAISRARSASAASDSSASS